jgi:hypothetical protein
MTPEQMKYKGVVLQIMPDCVGRGIGGDPNIWDWLLVRNKARNYRVQLLACFDSVLPCLCEPSNQPA